MVGHIYTCKLRTKILRSVQESIKRRQRCQPWSFRRRPAPRTGDAQKDKTLKSSSTVHVLQICSVELDASSKETEGCDTRYQWWNEERHRWPSSDLGTLEKITVLEIYRILLLSKGFTLLKSLISPRGLEYQKSCRITHPLLRSSYKILVLGTSHYCILSIVGNFNTVRYVSYVY